MRATGSQILLATQALPGAQILQLDAEGIAEVTFDDSELVKAWRAFLDAPDGWHRVYQGRSAVSRWLSGIEVAQRHRGDTGSFKEQAVSRRWVPDSGR